jgi:poly(3-hydroxyalkanoate) synthetase
MANTQSMTTSFMGELMTATHNFGVAPTRGTSATDTFKAALYLTSATYNAATTAYSATGEVSGTGYTAGGVTVTAATAPTATNSSATAGVAFFTPSASITYTSVTLTTAFDAVLIYNSTQSNKAVAVYTFGSQTITAGTFTLTMPSNTTTTALLRLATT